MPWTYLCLAIVLLVLVRLAIEVVGAVRRLQHDRQRRAFEREQFAAELAALRESQRRQAQEPQPWTGFRKFAVTRMVRESESVRSFHLTPHDGKPLPPFQPGQYVTFRLPGGAGAPVVRCYSLSDRPQPSHYRVTIKRAAPPADVPGAPGGRCSTYFHEQVKEGDIIDLRAPTGNFHLAPEHTDALVFVGAGIGVTPILSMLAALAHQHSRRPIWFFYGVRDRSEHLFRAEIEAIARDLPNLQQRVCYSRPRSGDRPGEDYHVKGRVTVDLLRRELPANNFRFYYCGPAQMMEDLMTGLKLWGVPENHLHCETFGALSVKRVSHAVGAPAAGGDHLVTFRKSGLTRPWNASQGTLLDFAEQAGVAVPSGCRAGNCGSCLVAMEVGEVSYVHEPGSPPEARTCLMCIAQPKGDVVLDA